jgi:hypothetical protein
MLFTFGCQPGQIFDGRASEEPMSSFSPRPLGRAANRDGDARLAIVVAAQVQPEAVVRVVVDLGLVVPACVDPPPLLVVTVPEATRSYWQMALIDETLAGAGWCGPPVVEPVDPAAASEQSALEAQLQLSELLERLHATGVAAFGWVSPQPGVWHGVRRAARECTRGVAVVAPAPLSRLRTLAARLVLRIGSPHLIWLGAWAAGRSGETSESRHAADLGCSRPVAGG